MIGCLIVCASLCSAQNSYVLTNVGHLPGTTTSGEAWSAIAGLSASGRAVGAGSLFDTGTTNFGLRPFRFSNGVLTQLPIIGTNPANGSANGVAYGINGQNIVVGYSDQWVGSIKYDSTAVTWDANDVLTILGGHYEINAGQGKSAAGARAINETGTVTGWARRDFATTGQSGDTAAIWVNGSISELEQLYFSNGVLSKSIGRDINSQGVVSGSTAAYDANSIAIGDRPVFWDGDGAHELPTYSTRANGYSDGEAVALNDAGWIVGNAFWENAAGTSGGNRPTLWINGVATDLGTIGGEADFQSGIGNDVNSDGYIVGQSSVQDPGGAFLYRTGFLYHSSFGMVEFNTLIDPSTVGNWDIETVTGIDDLGRIYGYGQFEVTSGNWQQRGFVAMPVQEALPDSFSIVRGFLNGGGLSDLFASDDLRLDIRAGLTLFLGEPPLQVVVVGTSPVQVPSELRFKLEASVNTPGLTQSIQLFNYVTSLYEEVDLSVPGSSDTSVEIVVTTNPGRYVQAGTREIRAKVVYQKVGFTLLWPWSARLDQAVWKVVP
ncbi:MAG: hypothetical protein IH945_07040 [Armatimonadetes bacterium]|nr:hypothetical protein [Armatimonadota bacterium]